MVVRFVPTVHGDGDKGFVAMVVAADRTAGSVAYIGEGDNRWPASFSMVIKGSEVPSLREVHRRRDGWRVGCEGVLQERALVRSWACGA